ncbi:MAG: formylmethanofuran dehydrogenase subunit E family protein [Acidimicrobiales bacterium]
MSDAKVPGLEFTAAFDTPTWSLAQWLDDPALPSFEVLDTRSAQGRLDVRAKTVTVSDLVLAHGHACDGLLRGVWAMRALFDLAFADAPIDRSDLMVVSKNSPCLGDVAAYLTGARARFGTHRLDDALGVGFQLKQLSTGRTWEVREEAGFFPDVIIRWEAALLNDEIPESDKRELLAVHEAAQWDWVREQLLPSTPRDHYAARELEHLDLPAPLIEARRSDTVNRLVPEPITLSGPDDPTVHNPVADELTISAWSARYQQGPL